jgi:hypothetical protein
MQQDNGDGELRAEQIDPPAKLIQDGFATEGGQK